MKTAIIELLNSEDWKDRFKGEMAFLKDKTDRLRAIVNNYDTLGWTPNCSRELLQKQLDAMESYGAVLKERWKIEIEQEA